MTRFNVSIVYACTLIIVISSTSLKECYTFEKCLHLSCIHHRNLIFYTYSNMGVCILDA